MPGHNSCCFGTSLLASHFSHCAQARLLRPRGGIQNHSVAAFTPLLCQLLLLAHVHLQLVKKGRLVPKSLAAHSILSLDRILINPVRQHT